MKVFITGGSGFIGKTLTKSLTNNGHQVTILTRKIRPQVALPPGAEYLEGDPTRKGSWQDKLKNHDIIINLAGASILMRWTEKNKKIIRDSRILTTKNIVDGLAKVDNQDILLLSTSAVGYYGFRGDELLAEDASPGTDFLAGVAVEWEREALRAESFGVRVIICRFGLVLGRHGGVLTKMVPAFKWGLGSPLASGKQWFSWIHEKDLAEIFLLLIRNHNKIRGPVNCVAPNPVTNETLVETLGNVLRRPTFLPHVPKCILRLVLGELAGIIVEGQRVYPKRLIEMKYSYHFPTLEEALKDIIIE